METIPLHHAHQQSQYLSVCCKKACQEDFQPSEKRQIEENFMKLNFQARTAFIRASISINPPKPNCYSLLSKKVCKNFFMSTLKITRSMIITALNKWEKGTTIDQRGKHGNHKMTSELFRESVITHLRSFPTYVSHYKREQSSSLYLDHSLNISTMYRLFIDQFNATHSETTTPPSYNYYYQCFNILGLKFKPLKTDTCKFCDLFQAKLLVVSSDEARKKIEVERKIHQAQAEGLRNQMKNDIERAKSDKSIQVLIYDLQKVLILPKAPSGPLYYTRNFNIYNLNIHENGNGTFHVWTELDASRGAKEISSCLINYMRKNIKEETEEIICWSDSCSGQNRNHITATMLLAHLNSTEHPKLSKITLKFLKSGHTYNACDADFGVLEKSIRSHQTICTVDQYLDIMAKSRIKNPFNVVQMSRDDFIDAKNILKNITKRDFERGTKVAASWLKTHELVMTKNNPFSLYLKYLDAEDFIELNYAKLKRKGGLILSSPWNEVTCGVLYPNGRMMSAAKKKDLLSICHLLPPEGEQFIKKITDCETDDFPDDFDGIDESDFLEMEQYED